MVEICVVPILGVAEVFVVVIEDHGFDFLLLLFTSCTSRIILVYFYVPVLYEKFEFPVLYDYLIC